MPYLVTGTRERIYPPRPENGAVGAVEDELDAMGPRWIALTSEPLPDGSLRVIYGRLPDEATAEHTGMDPVPAGRGISERATRAAVMAVVLGAIVVLAMAGIALIRS